MSASLNRADSYTLTVAGLAVLALSLFAYPVLRVGTALEIDYNEGWNAYQQMRAMAGLSLYSADTPLFVNNYPPLSFYLVGLLGTLTGDMVLAGRLFSLLAVAVIALSAGMVARAAGARKIDAILSSSAALGMLSGFAADYVGTNDPQLLAQGFLCAGFALYVNRWGGSARLPLVALLFATGLLCKHNVLALPLVTTIHLLWRGSNQDRALYLGTGLGLAALALAVIESKFGAGFFRNLLASRQYDPARGVILSTEMLDVLQAPLAVIGLYYVLGRDGRIATKTGAYLALSLLLAMGFSGGAGVDTNIFFDPMIACAMGAGPAVAWLRARPGSGPWACAALALTIHAGLIFHMPIALGRFAVDMAGDLNERERLFLEDVAWLKTVPGPAICESMLLCLRAGKPMWIDPYAATQAITNGRLPPDTLTGMLARREVAVVQIVSRRAHHADEPVGAQSMPPRFINFADDVFDELDRSYAVRHVGITGRFYLPK
jgi:hypothetical protein